MQKATNNARVLYHVSNKYITENSFTNLESSFFYPYESLLSTNKNGQLAIKNLDSYPHPILYDYTL